MSWSYVGAFQFVGGTAATYSPSFVGTLAENDLAVLAFLSKSDGVTPAQLSIGSGWTLLHASESTTTSEPGLHVWYCIAGAGGSIPSTTVTRAGGERHNSFGFAYRHSGGAPVKLTDAVAVKLASSTTATLAGGINPSAAGSLLISAIVGGVVGVPNNITATSPSAYSASSSTTTTVSTVAPASDEWVQRFGTSSTAGSDHSVGLADAVKTAAGSTGSITWTKAASSMNTVFAVAFGPAGSGGGDTTAPTLTGSITISALTTTSYTATWPAGSDDTAVTGYEYRIASGSWVDAGNVLTVDITGRTPGATETFEVRAYDAAANVSTPALSTSVTLNSATATVTVTEPLKNNTGTLLASQSGITVAVLQAADLVSVYETTGLTTNASGVLSAISNAAMTTGQQYHVAIKLADGGVGITGPITAS